MQIKYIFISLLVIVTFLIFSFITTGISLYNQEVALRNKIESKQEANKAIFDNTWKKIKQATQVSDKYKDGFKEVLETYTNGRKEDSKNLLMRWGNEALPNLDPSIYKQLSNIIVSSRDDFTMNQEELIDLNREHTTLISVFPNNLYFRFMGINKIDIKTVTSNKTESAFNSQKEDNVDL